MKKLTTFLFLAVFGCVLASAQITPTADYTGTPDEVDIRAAHLIIEVENERRAALETPLPALPTGTNAELAASYKTALGYILQQAHANYREQANRKELADLREAILNATDAELAQIRTYLGL
jgi:hypothetical protein